MLRLKKTLISDMQTAVFAAIKTNDPKILETALAKLQQLPISEQKLILAAGSPLTQAIKLNNLDMVKMLLQAGAEPKLIVIFDAIIQNNLAILQELFRDGFELINQVSGAQSPLLLALNRAKEHRDLKIVKFLLGNGARPQDPSEYWQCWGSAGWSKELQRLVEAAYDALPDTFEANLCKEIFSASVLINIPKELCAIIAGYTPPFMYVGSFFAKHSDVQHIELNNVSTHCCTLS